MPLVGPLTFLLGLLIACYAGAKEAVTMHEIEQLQWEATVQKEYARKFRYARQQALHDEKAVYDREIIGASEEEILASKIRFYEKAAIITNRYDILLEIRELQQFHALDSIIEEAVQRRLGTQELYRSYVYQAPER